MVKEISLGLGLAVSLFLLYNGINVFPVIFFLAIGYYLFNHFGNRANSDFSVEIGQSDNKNDAKKDLTFADIGGQKVAKKELLEALDFVKKQEKIKELGIRPLKGILMSGPPGTGKTLLAKAAANYIDSIFLSTSGSDFIEMYAGVGAKRVRGLFDKAKQKAKKKNKNNAVIFIDEIDVLGSKRGASSNHMEYDQTLNQLLVEMDGLKATSEVNILLIGATNRLEALDKAIMRPGRFDRVVKVNLPDKKGREEILKIHTRNKPLAQEIDLKDIAQQTFQFSGAHLECLTNEAAIMALREGEQSIKEVHFKEAIDKVIMGEKLNRAPAEKELKRIALHETGHALISETVKPGSVSSITITSRGKALGYVRHNEDDDNYLHTAEYLKDKIAILMAGSLVEEMLLGNRSTGAANDFEKAVAMAKKIVFSGMSKLGVVSNDSLPRRLLYETITEIIKRQEIKVKKVISNKQEFIKKIADELLETETITGEDFRALLKENNKSPYQQLALSF